jgi:hypothetical protein
MIEKVHMSEDTKIRKDLERAVGRLSDAVWEDLVEEKIIRMYLEGTLELDDPDKSWETLKSEAQKRVRFAERCVSEAMKQVESTEGNTYDDAHGGKWRWVPDRASPDKPERDERDIESILDYFLFIGPESTAMFGATSDFFEWLANRHPEVVQFRDRVLEGRTLAPDKARRLIGSYAARFFPLEFFIDLEIPVVGHTSEIVGEYEERLHDDEIDHRVTVQVDPPGITERVRYAPPDTPMSDEDQIPTWCFLKNSGEVISPYKVEIPADEDIEPMRPSSSDSNMGPILLGNYETASRPWSVWPGSIVDNLYALADELADALRWPQLDTEAEEVRWWRKDAAAEFVLTGVAPQMRPLDARLYKEGRYPSPRWQIELDVLPWVSAEEVERAYRRMQAQVFKGRRRLPDSKTLEVARFVWEQDWQHGYNRPTWPALCKRWNEEHPKDQFEDYHHFRTYFKRAEEAVKKLNFS